MKQHAKGSAWQSRAHRVWFRACAACLSVYIAYVTYLSQSGFLTSAPRTLSLIHI